MKIRIVTFALSLLTFCFFLTACATVSLTAAGEKVRVTKNPDVVAGCQYIDQVEGGEKFFGGATAEENAMRRLKNNTAEMGGNVVFLNTYEVSDTGAGAKMRGEVYHCK